MTPLTATSALARALHLNLMPQQATAVVAFSGSGGKTTCAEELAGEAVAAGRRVILTTTTKMRIPQNLHQVDNLQQVADLVHSHAGAPLVLGKRLDKKMVGPPLPLLGEVAATGLVDLMVVEADGSRGASVKGYRRGEPVLPSGVSRVCVLVGVDAVGAGQNETAVHRGSILWPILGLRSDQRLRAEDVARALFEQPGYFDQCQNLPVSLIVNKADDASTMALAEQLLAAFERYLPQSPVDQVVRRGYEGVEVIWQCHRSPIAALLLAAGTSTRFGDTKQMALMDGQPLVRRSATVLRDSAADAVVAVLGYAADEVRPLLPQPMSAVINPRFQDGMSSSIQAGLAALPEHAGGVLIALADMPHLRTSTVDAVVRVARSSPLGIVVPTYRGRRGHPVFFARRHFEALRRLHGDVGGAAILRQHPHDLLEHEVDDPGILEDVDRPADL